MALWQVGLVTNLLAVFALLAVASALVRFVPTLRRISVPPALVAGAIGLALGKSGAGVLPTDSDDLEIIVYHAFAVVFIAVGLQAPPGRVESTGGARSLAIAIPTFAAAQAVLGFLLVAGWFAISGTELHPGFGWMITLGFSQGPGQALALGGAWESQGMVDGAQIGLLFAAIGFLYCGLFGIPLVAYARRKGWMDPEPAQAGEEVELAPRTRAHSEAGGLEPLTIQLVLVGCAYIGVFAVLWLASAPLPESSPLRATFWGFHFIVGAAVGIAVRGVARRIDRESAFDDDLLARISVVAVEISTAAAIAAVELDVLGEWLAPVALFTAIAGGTTLLASIWVARRAFPEAPFAHCLVLYGLATGTISTGLVLVRSVDPELKGPVARNVVLAATGSVPVGAPLFLGIIPFSVGLWTLSWGTSILWPLVALAVYLLALAWAWRRFTPFRSVRPWTRLWPP